MSKRWIRPVAVLAVIYMTMFVTQTFWSSTVERERKSNDKEKYVIFPWELCGKNIQERDLLELPSICKYLLDYNKQLVNKSDSSSKHSFRRSDNNTQAIDSNSKLDKSNETLWQEKGEKSVNKISQSSMIATCFSLMQSMDVSLPGSSD